MLSETGGGLESRFESDAHRAASLAANVGVAVEEGGYLKLLNEPAKRHLLFAEGQSSVGFGRCRIPLEALPARFVDPPAFSAWRESVLETLPGSAGPGRFWTTLGRFLEFHVVLAEGDSGGIFTWAIRDRTAGEKGKGDLEEAKRGLRRALEGEDGAHRAKTHFLSMMSHEVRTPMNAILGMTELLLHTPLSREQWSLLDTVRNAGECLIRILDNVLAIGKVDSGTLPLARRVFSLSDLVESLTEEVAPAGFGAGLEVSCAVDPRIPSVLEGDPEKLRQVLSNLLANAMKFTRQGSVAVTAELVDSGSERHRVRFSVEDTGPGIRPDSVERIFEPFFQTGMPEDGDARGVGLGLSIVRSFVDLMEGRIEVDSSPGQGTRFDVTVPLWTSETVFPGRRASDHRYPDFRAILLSPSERFRSSGAQVFTSLDAPFSISRNPGDLAAFLKEEIGGERTVVFVDQRFRESELDWIRHHLTLLKADRDLSLVVLVSPGVKNGQPEDRNLRSFHLPKPMTRRGVAGIFREIRGENVPEQEEDFRTEGKSPDLAGLRVLLVEDRDENRNFLGRVLEGAGIRVDAASDGEIGHIQYQTGRYDLVLTDLDMPGFDGFYLLREIRETEREEGRRKVPVVAITAHTDPATAEKCFRSGMDAFLTKPVSSQELLKVVREMAGVEPLILVVEDDDRSREVTCQILSKRGFRVEGVGMGAQAIGRVNEGGVAAVLLDMTLPDMSGLEVVEQIRSLPEGSELPVVGVTGHTGEDQAARCREAGCSGFVEKPVRWEALLETLDALLMNKKDLEFTPLLDGLAHLDPSGLLSEGGIGGGGERGGDSEGCGVVAA